MLDFLKLLAFDHQDGVLRDDEVFLTVVLDFDGVFLEEHRQVAGPHLQGQVAAFASALVPHLALLHVGQRVAGAAFKYVARLHLFLVLVAGGQIEAAFGAVGSIGGFYQHSVTHNNDIIKLCRHSDDLNVQKYKKNWIVLETV